MILILLLGLILYLMYKTKKLNTINNQSDNKKSIYKFDKDFNDYDKKIIVKLYDKFKVYTNGEVGLDYIMTTVWQEAGSFVMKNIPNEKIIGDNGNSIGYFQIYKFGALLAVNERENKNYKFENLKDEKINVYFGVKYLSYCISSAIKQARNKPIAWLVAKKYNGGLDETESSVNKQAENYANNYYNKFLKVKKFLELNII